jgi:hypothetical protein
MEAGGWRLEDGSWKLEVGSWKLEVGSDPKSIRSMTQVELGSRLFDKPLLEIK